MHMRKRIITSATSEDPTGETGWLNLESLADVELSSEDSAHPIESALVPGRTGGWRAAARGKQTIRLRFAQPQKLQRIILRFDEPDMTRTQEYLLSWSDDGQTFRDIARQQWNFSPQGATNEIEEHKVELATVSVLELTIIPDIGGGNACASLAQMRLA
jgi:F5/8 type C domain